MKTSGTLQITTPTPRETVLTREFNAPPELVFEALYGKLDELLSSRAVAK